MKYSTIMFCFGLLAVAAQAESDIFFLPAEAGASVSFEGVTQAGRDQHRFEVRRLAYVHPEKKEAWPSGHSCVIYFSGGEYGPYILKEMEAIAPLVRKVGNDAIEVFFTTGAHTHIRQKWKLLGYTAQLEKEEEISWKDDPRTPEKPNQPPEPTPRVVTPPAAQESRRP